MMNTKQTCKHSDAARAAHLIRGGIRMQDLIIHRKYIDFHPVCNVN
ncbi:hypothetical protein AW02_012190 [Bacillus velezensis NJN-6]|nr:hypothetical protein U722_06270 [Bacillus amyloliquefaciens LFB112]AKD29370.1 hypothetical protein AW02_012190 [Bacillus velezensis NJN-6]MBB4872927.1 hypothetical protein [Bacillus velezensis]